MSKNSPNTFSIGIDVGGTNTDAVMLQTTGEGISVLASVKTATTQDVVTGIRTALSELLAACLEGQLAAPPQVRCVFLGTTKFLNALLECKNLLKVGIVRLCLPTTTNHPPLIDWPEQLKNTVLRGSWLKRGGYEFYPDSEISALEKTDLDDVASDVLAMLERDRPAEIVISGVHAPLKVTQENDACELLREALKAKGLTNIRVTSSCEAVGRRIGILKRENAAVLNACLRKNAAITVTAFGEALADAGLAHARAFLTTSDGTVVDGAGARRRPVQCIASGPVNSIRGAGVLLNDSESTSIFVVDVGGTTTDVGVLLGRGAERHVKESNSDSRVGGVRTNNRVADVLSIALGGGSIFRTTHFDTSSVGYKIKEQAVCCGGDTATFTDVALACKSVTQTVDDGWASVRGDALRATLQEKTGASMAQLQGAYTAANQRVADLVSKLKPSASNEGVRVILAGGGGALLDQVQIAAMLGMEAAQVVTINHGDVANACGAGVGQVGAELETTADMPADEVEDKVAQLKAQVQAMAVQAGGVEGTAVIAQQEVTAIPFVEGSTRRVYMKAVADLNLDAQAQPEASLADDGGDEAQDVSPAVAVGHHVDAPDIFNPPPRSDKQVDASGVWTLSEYDIHCLAVGCGVLGCGGGGSTHKGFLSLKRMVREGKPLRVIGADRMPPGSMALPAAFMGVPTVIEERIQVTGDLLRAGQKVLDMAGGVPPQQAYVISAEVGGCNGLEPLVLQAQTQAFAGVLDADLMGRAFPELQMQTMTINGLPVLPAALSDAHGRVVSIKLRAGEAAEGQCPYERELFDAEGSSVEVTDPWCYGAMGPFPSDAKFLENELRPHLLFSNNPFAFNKDAPPGPENEAPRMPGMGMVAGLALKPMTPEEVQTSAIPGTLSLGRALGDAILTAKREQSAVLEAVQKVEPAAALLASGIVDLVDTDTAEGFAKGRATIQAEGRRVELRFQNEFLRCSVLDSADAPSTCLGEVPDLITVLDAENGAPIATEELKYGFRVIVLSLPANPRLRTPAAMAVVGPSSFASLAKANQGN